MGRIAGYDGPGGDIFRHDGCRGSYGTFAERDSGKDECVARDPDTVAESDRFDLQFEDRTGDVVSGRAEKRAGAHHAIAAQRDVIHRIDLRATIDPAMVADRQVPRLPDFRTALNAAALPDLRTERTEQEAAPAVQRPPRRGSSETRPDNFPKQTLEPAASGVTVLIFREFDFHSILIIKGLTSV